MGARGNSLSERTADHCSTTQETDEEGIHGHEIGVSQMARAFDLKRLSLYIVTMHSLKRGDETVE